MLEPLLGGVLELGGHHGGLWEAERTGRAAQAMGVAPQRLERFEVVAARNEALGELGDHPKLVAGPSQVLVPDTGWQAEIVDRVVRPALPGAPSLAHGHQDITSFCFDLMAEHEAGLCGTCKWVRILKTRRGSVFYRCLRAETDPRFVKYPPLPVLRCPGYDRRDPGDDALAEPERDGDQG